MKIVTWNVNSIRARLPRVLAWLDKHQPDIVCLQELKCVEDDFPLEEIAAAGYSSAVCGQKTYNGVAILSRGDQANIICGMGDASSDPPARLVSAEIQGIVVICAYFPNGAEVGSESFANKLEWMSSLRWHLDAREDITPDRPVVLCGDFNVVIDDGDAAHPAEWEGGVLTVDEVRDALTHIRQWGFADVFRKHNPDGGVYSWWDYRRLGFQKNNGLRLDHVYATSSLADLSISAIVDRDERKGEKPSDHAPIITEFNWPE